MNEVENLIAQGSLDVPPAIYDLVVTRRLVRAAVKDDFFSRLREAARQRFAQGPSPASDEIDERLEQVIAYIEDRLEGRQ